MSTERPEPVFQQFGGEELDEPAVTEIESLCMNCHANVRKHRDRSNVPKTTCFCLKTTINPQLLSEDYQAKE